MHLLVTGATGMLGSALVQDLKTRGHTVRRLLRRVASNDSGDATWDPSGGQMSPSVFDEIEAVVHLAGESIATGRWNADKKKRIRESRVRGTKLIAETLASLARPPRVLVSASAIGYYGDRGETILDEDSHPAQDFLADVCQAWEDATAPAVKKGIRVVNLRFGVILSRNGGALKKMLLPFSLGLGGRVGDGKQFMSWISLRDAVGVVEFAVENAAVRGPVNTVAPNPATNEEFTKKLGAVLHRRTILPMPAFAARLAFGEMADALLLSSARVLPKRLRALGYPFLHETLEPALRFELSR